jgi:hypothetical protein
MAKRSRTSGRPGRPGQRRPIHRTAARPGSAPPATSASASTAEAAEATVVPVRPSTGLTETEAARAAELEAQIVAEEKAAETGRRMRGSRRAADPTAVYTSQGLSERASVEYAYVVRDLKRIVVVGGGLLILLFALSFVIHIT